MRLTLMMTAIALSTAASAAKDASRPMLTPECRTEIMTLCPKGTDKAARQMCMREKRASISPGCKADMMKVRQERRALRAGSATPAPAVPTGSNTASPN